MFNFTPTIPESPVVLTTDDETVVEERPVLILTPAGQPVVFVNVYAIDRRYGGPEEGGWWYDAGEPVGSVACVNRTEAGAVMVQLQQQYPKTKKRYSMGGVDDWDVLVEEQPPKAFPAVRPHYC